MQYRFVRTLAAALGLWLASGAVHAAAASEGTASATTSAPAVGAPQVTSQEAPLTVFNREVFTFRGALLGVSAPDRARRAHTRISEQLEAQGPNVVALKTEAIGILVQIDGGTSFAVTPGDVDITQGETLEGLATQAAAALRTVIAESRESRDLQSMGRAALLALAASAVALALWWLAARTVQVLTGMLLDLTQRHAQRLKLAGVQLLHGERVVRGVQLGVQGVYRLLLFVLFYNWLSFVLSRFPFTRAWGEALSDFLFDLVASMGNAMLHAVPGLVTAVLIFWIARWFNGVLGRFFERVRTGQVTVTWLDADVAVPTRRIATVVVWLFALAMAYPYLPGSDTEAFRGLSVLAGLMLSLGASSLVGQAVSGLILTYGRVFRKGEFVSVAGHEGTVTEVGMFSTRIRTGLGEEITIANNKILDASTKNYSRAVQGTGFVLDTSVSIGYDTPWRQVHALLEEAARRTEGVLADPAPVVFQTALSDWYPQYRLVCQAIPSEPRPRAVLLSNLLANIQDVFNEYGVQIMSPQYIEDPREPKVVPPKHWYAAPARRPSDLPPES